MASFLPKQYRGKKEISKLKRREVHVRRDEREYNTSAI